MLFQKRSKQNQNICFGCKDRAMVVTSNGKVLWNQCPQMFMNLKRHLVLLLRPLRYTTNTIQRPSKDGQWSVIVVHKEIVHSKNPLFVIVHFYVTLLQWTTNISDKNEDFLESISRFFKEVDCFLRQFTVKCYNMFRF